MKRYLKIYLQLIKINFSKLAVYRVNFISSFVSSVGWGVVGIFTMYIITSRISGAFGWTKYELILLAAMYPLFTGIFYMFFSKNLGRVPDVIHMGELDGILLKPVDEQFLLSLFFIDFMQIFRILISLAFIILFSINVHFSISIASIILSILFTICGLLLLYSIWFGVITISMWFSTLSNLKDLLYVFNGVMRYPSRMFRERAGIFFSILLPLSFTITTPTQILIQRSEGVIMILFLLLSITMFLVTRFFWKFALRFYTSASG